MSISVNELWTLILAVVAILLGMFVHRALPKLKEWNIPPAITGGLLIALGITVAKGAFDIHITFADVTRQTLLLIFFVGVGLSAKFGALIRGGFGVAALCFATTVAICLQNVVGVAIARSFDLESALGLFFGSIAFVGGHGTAAAWSQAAPAQHLTGALEVGMASATVGLIIGGLVAGPVASWLIRRQSSGVDASETLKAEQGNMEEEPSKPSLTIPELLNSDRWLVIVLIVGVCLALGSVLGSWAGTKGWVMPGFLAVMIVAILITNGADLVGRPVDLIVADLTGTVALRLFLAMSMMGLKLWELADFILPLLLALLAQTAIVILVSLLLVYPLMGRGRQGAVACGGFIGFAMGAMPVGLGVMKRLSSTFGDAPRAILAVTLMGALFADTANALLVNYGFTLLK